MPFWTGTNVSGSGMDAPSFRGLQDRWLLLPQGRVNMFEIVGPTLGQKGFDEFTMWTQVISGSTADEFQMFLEASMGYSGAFARQLTLNQKTATDAGRTESEALLDAIELAATEGSILLQGEGIQIEEGISQPMSLYFRDDLYHAVATDQSFSREQLLQQAADGSLVATLTGHLQEDVNYDNPQPEIWSTQLSTPVGKIAFPRLFDNEAMRLKGRHLGQVINVYVDGRIVPGEVSCENGELPDCLNEVVLIQLEQMAGEKGMHFLQLQTERGLMSNEYLFFVI